MRVLWVALAVVVADQLAKVAVKLGMDPYDTVPIVGRLFRLTFTENPGMAFGLTIGSKLFLTVFSIAATVGIGAYLWAVRRGPLGYRVALALILGGAFGNIIDRTFFGMIWGECEPPYGHRPLYGCVVDFIHLDLSTLFSGGTWPQWVPAIGGRHVNLFPIGNVADLAIIGGVAALLLFQRKFQAQLQAQGLQARAQADEEAARAEATPPAEAPVAPRPPTA